jgi:hypothetical protein
MFEFKNEKWKWEKKETKWKIKETEKGTSLNRPSPLENPSGDATVRGR